LKTVIDEAQACRESKERKNILFLISGNSNLDIDTFKDFLEGAVEDHPFMEEQVRAALEQLPEVTQS